MTPLSNLATVSGSTTLDASVSGGGDVTAVHFVVSGGSLSNQEVAEVLQLKPALVE